MAVAVLATGLIASCGGVGSNNSGSNDSSDSDSKGKAKQATTLSVSGFGADDEIAQIRLDLAKRKLNVTPKLNKGAFDEQQFLSAVAAGDPPDVVNMGRDQVASYAARGALQPLDDCIADAKIDVSQYREQAMAPLSYDGKTYGIPEFYNYSLLLVNNRVAKEAGIDPASIDTGNWPQLLNQARAMTKTEGGKLIRLGFDPALPDSTLVWAAAHGVQPMAADGLTAKLDDPGMTKVFSDIKQLADVQGGWTKVKSFKDSWDFFGAKNPFVTDQVGALIVEQWYLTVLAETAPKDVDFTVIPIKDQNGKPITRASGSAWVVPKGSKNAGTACEFAREMTSVEAWVAAGQGKVKAFAKEGKYYAGTYGGNQKADVEIFGTGGEGGIWKPVGGDMAKFDAAVEAALKQQPNAIISPASPIGAQFTDILQKALNRVLQGEQDVAGSLRRAQADVDKAAQAVR